MTRPQRHPYVGPGIATVSVIASLALLVARKNSIADIGVLICAAVAILEGVILVFDFGGRTTAIRQDLLEGRSTALANMPDYIIRLLGAMFVVVGIGGIQAGLRALS